MGSGTGHLATAEHGSVGRCGWVDRRGSGTLVPVAQRPGGARGARLLGPSVRGSRSGPAARTGSAPVAMAPRPPGGAG